MDTAPARPLNLFISYSHKDEKLCHALLDHLSQMQRDGIQGWYDRRVEGGEDWAGQIDQHLNTAEVILALLSSDFFASKYCYDVEMTRAIERHKEGSARLVPIVLRACDWKNSPFSKLGVLPLDGKPVVEWKTRDRGFLNVVEGLRRVVEELRQRPVEELQQHDAALLAAPGGPTPVFRAFPNPRRLRWAAAAASILLLALGWFWWNQQQHYIAQGEASLDVGRYVEARQPFEQALRWNPMSPRASHGLAVARLYDLLSMPVEFERALHDLTQAAPNDPHLKILEGDSELGQDRRDQALADYRMAARMSPQTAEAHHRMCFVYDLESDWGKALDSCQKAVDLAPFSPQYRANLAAQFFKLGQYQDAVREYRKVVDGYPLAKLELAAILRLQRQLEEAQEQERLATGELANDSVMASLPENSLPWVFAVGGNEAVSIPSRDQKLCYAHLELSATLYLLGDEPQSTVQSNQAAQACSAQTVDIKAILDWELTRLANEQDGLRERAQKYHQILASWGRPNR